eukprot:1427229-Rhodomonas_salina.3
MPRGTIAATSLRDVRYWRRAGCYGHLCNAAATRSLVSYLSAWDGRSVDPFKDVMSLYLFGMKCLSICSGYIVGTHTVNECCA